MNAINNVIYHRLIQDDAYTFRLGQSILPLKWGGSNLKEEQTNKSKYENDMSCYAPVFEKDYMTIPKNLRPNYIKEFTIPLIQEDYNDTCSRFYGGSNFFITDRRHIRLDYYFPSLLLDIEVDGSGCHNKLKDKIRDIYLYEKFGIRVIRLVDYTGANTKWKKDVMMGAGKLPIPLNFQDEIVRSFIDTLPYGERVIKFLDFIHKYILFGPNILTGNFSTCIKNISPDYVVDYDIYGGFLTSVKNTFNYIYEGKLKMSFGIPDKSQPAVMYIEEISTYINQ